MLRRYLPVSTTACAVTLSLVAFLCAGCGGSSLPAGPKGTVSGKVTYNGDPVPEKSSVSFMHAATSQTATSTVAAGGTYTLRMQGGTQVLAGDYQISVAPPAAASVDDSDMDAYAEMMEGGGSAAPPTAFPDKYNSFETSGLTFTVAEGANTHDIDLTD